jgi:2-C-methyl-D-erythritol 4-phosphate cytidylyltransferase
MAARRYWAVIPAAGIGARMASEIPKQYLPLCGRPVLEHSLARFCAEPRIAGVIAVVAGNDPYYPDLPSARHPKVTRADGGPERCHSVLNGLRRLREMAAADDDWVLVHDAARPCVRQEDVARLLDELSADPVGGLLAVPARDTIKRVDGGGAVAETIDRDILWRALTPQMFRLGALTVAIEQALARGVLVTDEAQAIELAGAAPRLVAGHEDNIKITTPGDLALAEFYLRQREGECA